MMNKQKEREVEILKIEQGSYLNHNNIEDNSIYSVFGSKMRQTLEESKDNSELQLVCLRRDSIREGTDIFLKEKNSQETSAKKASKEQIEKYQEEISILKERQENEDYLQNQNFLFSDLDDQTKQQNESNNIEYYHARENFTSPQSISTQQKPEFIFKGYSNENERVNEKKISIKRNLKQNSINFGMNQQTETLQNPSNTNKSMSINLGSGTVNFHSLNINSSISNNNNNNNYNNLFLNMNNGIQQKNQKISSKSNNKYETLMNMKSEMLKVLTWIKPKMKKFYQQQTLQGRTKQLTLVVRNHIDDVSDWEKESKNGFPFRKMREILEAIYKVLRIEKIPLFDPENKWKIALNSLIVCYNCIFLLVISIKLFFNAHYPNLEHSMMYAAQAAWVTEMIVQMNTACYHHNEFTTDRSVIMKIYLKEYFFFEIIPLIFEGRSSDNQVTNILLHLPLLLKLKGMLIILKKLEFYVLLIIDKHYLLQLFKLLIETLILAHIIACLWNALQEFQIAVLGANGTWKQLHNNHQIDNWDQAYIESLYYAFSTMMTVSTSPITLIEKGFTSLLMLISSMQLAFIISTIDIILTDISKSQKDYKKDLNVLNLYMRRKKIEMQIYNPQFIVYFIPLLKIFHSLFQSGLQRRVNIHLKKQYIQQGKDKILIENKAISKLSTYMQQELIIHSNKKILKNFQYFYHLFQENTLQKIYQIMEETVYAPSQIIYGRQTEDEKSKSIYFIIKGTISIFVENESYGFSNPLNRSDSEDQKQNKKQGNSERGGDKSQKKCIGILKAGECFGVQGFFTGNERICCAQSSSFSTIIKIDRVRMLEILKEESKDFEKFNEIKDKIIFDCKYSEVELKCLICNSKEHLFENCNKSHFDKKNILTIHKHNYSQNQVRQSFYRKNNDKHNVKFQFKEINKLFEEFQMNNYQNDNSYISCDEDSQESTHSLVGSYIKRDQSEILEKNSQEEFSEIKKKDTLTRPQKALNSFIDSQRLESFDKRERAKSHSEVLSSREGEIESSYKKNPSLFLSIKLNNKQDNDTRQQYQSQDNISSLQQQQQQNNKRISFVKVSSNLENEEGCRKKGIKIKSPKRRNSQKKKTVSSLDKQFSYGKGEENISWSSPSGLLPGVQINQHDMEQIQPSRFRYEISSRTKKQKTLSVKVSQTLIQQQQQQIAQQQQQQSQGQGINQQFQQQEIQQSSLHFSNLPNQLFPSHTNHRQSILRTGTINPNILFKRIGSTFHAISNNAEDINLYWRFDKMANYLRFYPEFNSQEVIKRIQIFNLRTNKKISKFSKRSVLSHKGRPLQSFSFRHQQIFQNQLNFLKQ